MHTTLKAILAAGPCGQEDRADYGWQKLLAHLGKTEADDEPLSLLTILESNGLDDAIWALTRACPGYVSEARLFAVACASDVRHLMTEPRSIEVLDVAERYANGEATDEELAAAWAAGAAGADARAARAAAEAAREHQRAHFIRIFGGSNNE